MGRLDGSKQQSGTRRMEASSQLKQPFWLMKPLTSPALGKLGQGMRRIVPHWTIMKVCGA